MPTAMRGRVIWGIVAVAVIVAIAFALAPRPQPVESALVSGGPMRVALEAEGKTRVHDRYIVDAPLAGRLSRITLREGDAVTAGTIVAQIDPLPFRASIDETLANIAESRAQRRGIPAQIPNPAALAQARDRIASAIAAARIADTRVTQAQASDAQAQRDLERTASLAATGDIAHEALEAASLTARLRERDSAAAVLGARAAHADVAGAQAALADLEARRADAGYLYGVYGAQITAAEASLRKLRHDAVQTDVRAPVSGRVLHVLQESAANVSAGAPIIEIGNVGALEMVIDVLSNDAVNIAPGANVLVVGGDRGVLRGRVRLVESSAFTKVSALGIEEQRVNVIAAFIDPPSRLGDLYRVEAEIELWSARDVTRVPVSALFRCAENWCTYVIAGGRAHRRSVAIGHTNDEIAEVRSGLSRGERVVLHPADNIDDGTQVRTDSPRN